MFFMMVDVELWFFWVVIYLFLVESVSFAVVA